MAKQHLNINVITSPKSDNVQNKEIEEATQPGFMNMICTRPGERG